MPNLVDEILGAAKAGTSLSREYVAELAAGIVLAQVQNIEICDALPDLSRTGRNQYFKKLSTAYLKQAHLHTKGDTAWAKSGRLSTVIKKYTLQRDPVWANNVVPTIDPVYANLHKAMQFGEKLPQSASRIHEIVMEHEEEKKHGVA